MNGEVTEEAAGDIGTTVEDVVSGSCIVDQFQRLADLDDQERALLAALEGELETFEADQLLLEAGQPASEFYALHSGWACAVRFLPDGQRQVLDIFLPGQLMGLHEIGLAHAQSELVAITELEACAFPRQALSEVFRRSPKLAEMFFLSLAREQAMLTERIINIGRRPANERLAHFLLEMQARLDPETPIVDLPMTQCLIGDALGLSAVHVSRTLSNLRDEGLIDTDTGQVLLMNREALVEMCSFDPVYLDARRRWLDQA
jgi:CRP-like cAMP-binding protein